MLFLKQTLGLLQQDHWELDKHVATFQALSSFAIAWFPPSFVLEFDGEKTQVFHFSPFH